MSRVVPVAHSRAAALARKLPTYAVGTTALDLQNLHFLDVSLQQALQNLLNFWFQEKRFLTLSKKWKVTLNVFLMKAKLL